MIDRQRITDLNNFCQSTVALVKTINRPVSDELEPGVVFTVTPQLVALTERATRAICG